LLNAQIANPSGPSIGTLVFLPVFALLIFLGTEYYRGRAVNLPATAV